MMNRILLLIGALQGWALWGLWKARELKVWPAVDPISERALLYVSLALPLAYYLTEDIEALTKVRRTRILAGIAVLFALLGAYSGWAENGHVDLLEGMWSSPPARPSDLFAAAILGFVLIPLCAHIERGRLRWSYHALFETAWRNVLMMASAGVLTGVFWMVLFAGAMLMKSIGLNFVHELIEKAHFSIPVTGIVFGAVFALSLARANLIITLRRFWLSISAWLLPLLLLFSVMWVVALPFTGLAPFFKTHSASFILLWFIALSIKFANAAYQDGTGEEPYGRVLSRLLEFAWPSTVVLAAIAWWAMKLRIDQYGWTEDRVWAVFVLLLASLYAVGYAWSLRRRRGGWLHSIGQTNIVAAIVMCAGLLLLLSPVADARRIAVHSQMARLQSSQVAPDKIDYAYLRWQAGRYGQDALKQLAAGIPHKEKDMIAAKAKQTLAQQTRYSATAGAEKLAPQQFRQRFHVMGGAPLDDALLQAMQAGTRWEETRCVQIEAQCAVWMTDLDGDGAAEAVVLMEKPDWSSGNAIFYQRLASGQYQYGGQILFQKKFELLKADIEAGKVHAVVPRYRDLEIDGKRIRVLAEQH